MSALRELVLHLAAFAAVSGIAELLLPEGRLKQAFSVLMGLLAAKMILDPLLSLISRLAL